MVEKKKTLLTHSPPNTHLDSSNSKAGTVHLHFQGESVNMNIVGQCNIKYINYVNGSVNTFNTVTVNYIYIYMYMQLDIIP